MKMGARLLIGILAVVFAGSAAGQEVARLERLRGTVAIDLGNEGTTILVAIDEARGGAAPDGNTDLLFTLDLAGELERSPVYRLQDAELAYVLGERRLQVIDVDAGVNLLISPTAQPLMSPAGRGIELPILHFEARNLGIYTGWSDISLEEAIDHMRDAKAQARARREALSRSEVEIVPGTRPQREPRKCPDGGGGVYCEAGGCSTDLCGVGSCAGYPPSCVAVCKTQQDEFCCGGCYLSNDGCALRVPELFDPLPVLNPQR